MDAEDIAAVEARKRIEAVRKARAASKAVTPAQRRAERLAKRKAAEFEAGPGVIVRDGYGVALVTEQKRRSSGAEWPEFASFGGSDGVQVVSAVDVDVPSDGGRGMSNGFVGQRQLAAGEMFLDPVDVDGVPGDNGVG